MKRTIHLCQPTVWGLVILLILLTGCNGVGGDSSWVKSVTDLCVVVDQSYPGTPAGFSQPIGEEARVILERIGVKTDLGEGEDCQATLSIKLSIEPIAVPVSGAGDCYLSGNTDTEGQATLSAPGERTLRKWLNAPFQKPKGVRIVSSCPKKPEDAPLESTWAKSLESIFSEWWGAPGLQSMLKSELVSIRREGATGLGKMGAEAAAAVPDLIAALDDDDFWVSEYAIDALGAIGADAESAIPALIEKMKDPRYNKAYYALKKITGQDLGKDAAAWNQWWEAQP
jgi:hypothetical protein